MIYQKAIIPTVLIPFTLVSVVLSSIASFIAALFGIHLSTEGPRRLLEALLKPRVLIAALLMNGAIYGGTKTWTYWRNLPRLQFVIERENQALAKTSDRTYPDSALSEGGTERFISSMKSIDFDLLWSTQVTGGSFAGAARAGSSLFVGTEGGHVEEIDARSGDHKRTFYVGTVVSSAPLIKDGFLYTGEGSHETHHARVYRFNLASGQLAGMLTTAGHTEGRLVGATWDGRSYIFSPAGVDGMYAIDGSTMQPIWHRIEGHTDASAVISEGTVFWGTGREKSSESKARTWAIAAKIDDGKMIWKRELPASSWMQPAVVGGDVCFPVGEIYSISEVGGVFCFDRHDGHPTASFYLGMGVIASPVVDDSDLIVTSFHGRICRLSMRDRQISWCTETDDAEYSLAEVLVDRAHGLFVYPSRKGGLFVLEPRTGHVLARWNPEKPSSWESTYAPVRLGIDSWVFADMKGNLRALRPRILKDSSDGT